MIIFLADKTEYAAVPVFTALLRLLQESNQSVSLLYCLQLSFRRWCNYAVTGCRK